MHYMDAKEKAWRQLHKNAASNIEQVLEATPHKSAAVRPSRKLTLLRKLSKLDESVMRNTAGEVGMNS